MQPHGVDRYDAQDCHNRMDGLLEDIVPDTGRGSLFAPDFISAPTYTERTAQFADIHNFVLFSTF